MSRDFVFNTDKAELKQDDLSVIVKRLVYRHVAWIHALTYELRKLKSWEHQSKDDNAVRKMLGTVYSEKKFTHLKDYLTHIAALLIQNDL